MAGMLNGQQGTSNAGIMGASNPYSITPGVANALNVIPNIRSNVPTNTGIVPRISDEELKKTMLLDILSSLNMKGK